MKFAIFGSGFGLYGYLPAIVTGCGQSVLLPERYRSRLDDREDLRNYRDAVTWCADERAALDAADVVIISQRPADQAVWISECAVRPNIQAMILEKPLAPSPEAATAALDQLERSGKKFRIGFTFGATAWAPTLRQSCQTAASGHVSIDWQFFAHHYGHDIPTWKRRVSEGGGALRFFGIHLVALAAQLGYDAVVQSRCDAAVPDECESWTAEFIGPDLPPCRVRVHSRALDPRFTIDLVTDSETRRLVALGDPFAMEPVRPGTDRRVGLLAGLCTDLIEHPVRSYLWYRQSVKLWDKAENCR